MHVTSDVTVIVCPLIDNSYEPISGRNFDSYCKNGFRLNSNWFRKVLKFFLTNHIRVVRAAPKKMPNYV